MYTGDCRGHLPWIQELLPVFVLALPPPHLRDGCRRSTGGKGLAGIVAWCVICLAGFLLPPFTYLTWFTRKCLCFHEKWFFFLCFQIGFSATNSPDLVCECYCIGIPNIWGHLNGGRKCELVPSCYLQLDILQRNRAAWPGMGSVMGGLGWIIIYEVFH